MPSITVRQPFCPDLTSNHYLGRRADGRVYVKRHVMRWKLALIAQIRAALGGCWLSGPLTVRIDWQGPQQPDASNACKVVHDAVQAATLVNDREFIIEPGTYERKPAREAEITVTIRWE